MLVANDFRTVVVMAVDVMVAVGHGMVTRCVSEEAAE